MKLPALSYRAIPLLSSLLYFGNCGVTGVLAETIKVANGRLVGYVLLVPASPVEQADNEKGKIRLGNVFLKIKNLTDGNELFITTDTKGEFSIELAPGVYTLDMKEKSYIAKDLPARVEIRSSLITNLVIKLDSGMR